MYNLCAYQMIKRCVPKMEFNIILHHCHDGEIGGHFNANRTTIKVLHSKFYWPIFFKDVKKYIASCDRCQCTRNISQIYEMPFHNILVCDIFYVWGIDFMGYFLHCVLMSILW